MWYECEILLYLRISLLLVQPGDVCSVVTLQLWPVNVRKTQNITFSSYNIYNKAKMTIND